MRQIYCPVCQTAPDQNLPEYELVDCHCCGLTWTYISKEIDADALYEDEVYAVVDNRNSIFEKIIFREARQVINTSEIILDTTEPVKALDFGSGKGQFLFQAKNRGWETLGVETATARAAFAREKYGLPIASDFYQGGAIGIGNFDFISLFHVLEHLPDPLNLVQELCRHNLCERGLLVIEVPNYNSWQAKIAGKSWMHLDIPKHLSHWHEALLIEKLGELEFSPVKKQYFSLHLGVLGMLRAVLGKFGYKGNIIVDLKNRRKPLLLLGIAFCLPLSFLLESLSTIFRRGGIMRIYFRKP